MNENKIKERTPIQKANRETKRKSSTEKTPITISHGQKTQCEKREKEKEEEEKRETCLHNSIKLVNGVFGSFLPFGVATCCINSIQIFDVSMQKGLHVVML